MTKKIDIAPESRKLIEDAVMALGSLDTRELNWLIEEARDSIANKIERYETQAIRIEAPMFADKPLVSGGSSAVEWEDRKERLQKTLGLLATYRKLWVVVQKLSKAARMLSAEEFGAFVRANWPKQPR